MQKKKLNGEILNHLFDTQIHTKKLNGERNKWLIKNLREVKDSVVVEISSIMESIYNDIVEFYGLSNIIMIFGYIKKFSSISFVSR